MHSERRTEERENNNHKAISLHTKQESRFSIASEVKCTQNV